MNANREHRAYLLCLLLLLLSRAITQAQSRQLHIAAMAELTGAYSSIGEECLRGYKIAEEAFGEGLTVHYGDHQRKPSVGISEFWRFVRQEQVIAVVSNAAPVILAINPLSRDQRLPFAGTVVHPEFTDANPYAYRFWPTAKAEGSAIAAKLRELKFGKLAIVVLQDDYPVLIAREMARAFAELGGQVVFSDDITGHTSEYTSLLSRLRASRPDVIFVNVLGSQLSDLMRRLREQRLDQQLVGTFSLARQDIREAAGSAAEGAMFIEIDGNKPRFVRRLKERFGVSRSTGMNYACYTALAAILQTIRLHSEVVDSKTLQNALERVEKIPLLDGTLSLSAREAELELQFQVVRHGSIETMP